MRPHGGSHELTWSATWSDLDCNSVWYDHSNDSLTCILMRVWDSRSFFLGKKPKYWKQLLNHNDSNPITMGFIFPRFFWQLSKELISKVSRLHSATWKLYKILRESLKLPRSQEYLWLFVGIIISSWVTANWFLSPPAQIATSRYLQPIHTPLEITPKASSQQISVSANIASKLHYRLRRSY